MPSRWVFVRYTVDGVWMARKVERDGQVLAAAAVRPFLERLLAGLHQGGHVIKVEDWAPCAPPVPGQDT